MLFLKNSSVEGFFNELNAIFLSVFWHCKSNSVTVTVPGNGNDRKVR